LVQEEEPAHAVAAPATLQPTQTELLPVAPPIADPGDTTAEAAATPAQVTADPTGRKPIAIAVLGESQPVRSWKGVLLAVCNVLARRYPDDFATQAAQIKGRKRHYIAPASEGMISPAPIENTNLWVETNLSAVNIIGLIDRMLQRFGPEPHDLQITCREPV
jgi:negative regulator of replication initiation